MLNQIQPWLVLNIWQPWNFQNNQTTGAVMTWPRATRQETGLSTKLLLEQMWLAEPTKADVLTERALHMTQWIIKACDSCRPRRCTLPSKRRNYWWNNELESLRSACHRGWRAAHRGIGRINQEQKEHVYKEGHKIVSWLSSGAERIVWRSSNRMWT